MTALLKMESGVLGSEKVGLKVLQRDYIRLRPQTGRWRGVDVDGWALPRT
jgi:hypothetical protein